MFHCYSASLFFAIFTKITLCSVTIHDKNPVFSERELNERCHAAELANDQFDQRHTNRSYLGDMQDDIGIEKENLREQREQVAMLKEHLQDKVL
jgi:hypothetical protein